jgi:hypothetical protein
LICKNDDDLVNKQTRIIETKSSAACFDGYFQEVRSDGILIAITNKLYGAPLISNKYNNAVTTQAFLTDISFNPISFSNIESTTKWLVVSSY